MGVPWITEYYIISFESHLNSSLRENIKKLYFKISLLWASYQPPGMDKLVRVFVADFLPHLLPSDFLSHTSDGPSLCHSNDKEKRFAQQLSLEVHLKSQGLRGMSFGP